MRVLLLLFSSILILEEKHTRKNKKERERNLKYLLDIKINYVECKSIIFFTIIKMEIFKAF